MTANPHEQQIKFLTLVFTDIVGSGDLKSNLGEHQGVTLIKRHHAALRQTISQFQEGEVKETVGDSFLLVITRPSEAVRLALHIHARMRTLAQETGYPVLDRIGIHAAEVFVEGQGSSPQLLGSQVDVCTRVMSLGIANQVLMTRCAFENARRMLRAEDLPGLWPISWHSHGLYQFKGAEEPVEVCEVRVGCEETVTPPPDTDKAWRVPIHSKGPGVPILLSRSDSSPSTRARVGLAGAFCFLLALAIWQASWHINPSPPLLNSSFLPRRGAILDINGKVLVETPDTNNARPVRVYPAGHLASHVIEGIECSMNRELSGAFSRNGNSRLSVQSHGLNVVTTIDSYLQRTVEASLGEILQREGATSASCIIIRPRTGEILAFATLPAFDPGTSSASPQLLPNSIISTTFEPGSGFRAILLAAALDSKAVKLADFVHGEHGSFEVEGYIVKDDRMYGIMTVQQSIAVSSSVVAAKIGLTMGQQRLSHYIRNFGFGKESGIKLPGEIPGWTPSPDGRHHMLNLVSSALGHQIRTTPLQLALAMCTIANQGVPMGPLLVARLERSDGRVVASFAPHAEPRVVSEETAKATVEALKGVVSRLGTGRNAALDNYNVAGVTGTSQKPPYQWNRWYAYFLGFFPANTPEVCIYIGVDEPRGSSHSSGTVAAPTFKLIAEKIVSYLNVPHDENIRIAVPDRI